MSPQAATTDAAPAAPGAPAAPAPSAPPSVPPAAGASPALATPAGTSRITAPHSQAAAALAAALSGGLPEKKQLQPHGTPITPHQEVLELERGKGDSYDSLMVGGGTTEG